MITAHQLSRNRRRLARGIGGITREEKTLRNVMAIVANKSGFKCRQDLALRNLCSALL